MAIHKDKAKKASKKTARKGIGICERVRQKGGGYKTVCRTKGKRSKLGKAKSTAVRRRKKDDETTKIPSIYPRF